MGNDKPLTIGSARTSKTCISRQVEEQPYYDKDWTVIHPVNKSTRHLFAVGMRTACANDNLKYSQTNRHEIYKNGIEAKVSTYCDCSSLVNELFRMAGYKIGDWYTGSMVNICSRLEGIEVYKLNGDTSKLWNGDVLVYREGNHGHTAVVTHGGKVNFKPKKGGNKK